MHSSGMRTACSSSRWGVGVCLSACSDAPPRCGPGDPLGCGPGDPPRCGPGDHQGVDLETTPGLGLETPHPSQTPQLPPWVWAWKPTRHAGIPPSPQRPAARHAGIPPAMHAEIRPPPWTECQTCVKT